MAASGSAPRPKLRRWSQPERSGTRAFIRQAGGPLACSHHRRGSMNSRSSEPNSAVANSGLHAPHATAISRNSAADVTPTTTELAHGKALTCAKHTSSELPLPMDSRKRTTSGWSAKPPPEGSKTPCKNALRTTMCEPDSAKSINNCEESNRLSITFAGT